MTFTLTNTTSFPSSGATQLSYDATADQSKQEFTMIYPAESNSYRIGTIYIPQGSKFHPGAHWHEDYDEYMRVIKGRAKIRLGNEWKVYTPEDGDVLIRKGVVHDAARADVDAKPGEEDEGDLIMEERSDPVDGSKELFFRHAFSLVTDKAVFGWKLPLQQLLLLMYTDNYLSLVPGAAGWYFTHGMYAVIRPLAGLFGLKPFYDEYTPERLKEVRKRLEENGKKKRE